jgi:hypothetical protein
MPGTGAREAPFGDTVQAVFAVHRYCCPFRRPMVAASTAAGPTWLVRWRMRWAAPRRAGSVHLQIATPRRYPRAALARIGPVGAGTPGAGSAVIPSSA